MVPLAILVAEDDVTLGQALTAFLQEKGHEVDFARDGLEALELIGQKTYSLVITDLVMPGADGLEVLRKARQRDPATLVVIMTGHASIDSAIQATREGAYVYLRKPFNLQEIYIAVANAAQLLHLHRKNQELLHKLNCLTAKLEEQDYQRETMVREKAQEPAFDPSASRERQAEWERQRQSQADLERLHNLYRENLLTDKEYQVLKQRLFI